MSEIPIRRRTPEEIAEYFFIQQASAILTEKELRAALRKTQEEEGRLTIELAHG